MKTDSVPNAFAILDEKQSQAGYAEPERTVSPASGVMRVRFKQAWRQRADVCDARSGPRIPADHALLLYQSALAKQFLPKELSATQRHLKFSREPKTGQSRRPVDNDTWEVSGLGLFSKSEVEVLCAVEGAHLNHVVREHRKTKKLPFMWSQFLWLLAHEPTLTREVAYLPPAEQSVRLQLLREEVFRLSAEEFGAILSLSAVSIASLERFERRTMVSGTLSTTDRAHRTPLRIVLKLLSISPLRISLSLLACAQHEPKTDHYLAVLKRVEEKVYHRWA